MPHTSMPTASSRAHSTADSLHITPIPAFQDNYIWVLHNQHYCTVVDPGDATPVLDFLKKNQLNLAAILITHHHYDHVNGISELLSHQSCSVYGPATETIPHRTHALIEGDGIQIPELNLSINVLDVPGHTAGHIAFAIEHEHQTHLFCGDTLFSAGCGRLFEGTPDQMVKSLGKLKSFDNESLMYPTHEYTLSNIAWALTVEPENSDLHAWQAEAKRLRDELIPTLPVTLGHEKNVNPFLRLDYPSIRQQAELYTQQALETPVQVFAALREWKNQA